MDLQDKPDWIEQCELVRLKGGGTVHVYTDEKKRLVLCSECVKRGSLGAPPRIGPGHLMDGVKDFRLKCLILGCGSEVTVNRSEMAMLGLSCS